MFARFAKVPAGRERDDFATSLRCRRLAVGMGRKDLAEFLDVPITAVRNWERGKSRPENPAAVLNSLIKIQEELEKAYASVTTEGRGWLWIERTPDPLEWEGAENAPSLLFYMPRTNFVYRNLVGYEIYSRLPLCAYRVLVARLACQYGAGIIDAPYSAPWQYVFDRIYLYIKKRF